MIYDLSICVRLRHVRSANPCKYWRPTGDAMMFDPLERIQRRAFPLINVLSDS